MAGGVDLGMIQAPLHLLCTLLLLILYQLHLRSSGIIRCRKVEDPCDKGPKLRIYKELLELTNKMTTQFKKRAKEDKQVVNKHMKRCSTH